MSLQACLSKVPAASTTLRVASGAGAASGSQPEPASQPGLWCELWQVVQVARLLVKE